MLLLAYASHASYDFNEGDLITLLMNSRANNRRDGITGLLLHDSGRFLQFLEGESELVRRRYEAIRIDPRHHGVSLIVEHEQTVRQFPKWSMAYRTANDPLVQSIPGLSNFIAATTAQHSEDITALLMHFRRGDDIVTPTTN